MTTLVEFFSGQMDYVYFVYGLSFVFLAVVALLVWEREGNEQRLPWFLFVLFAIFHGVREWMDLFSMSFEDVEIVRAMRAGLLILSFICLLEFGRVGVKRLRGRGVGRWVLLPLFFTVLLGGSAGLTGLESAARYSFGFVGSLWAGAAFYELWLHDGKRCRWLLVATAGLALYAERRRHAV